MTGAERAVTSRADVQEQATFRERKATPSGVFDSPQKRAVRGLGHPQQAIGISVKDIANHCLPTLSLFRDNVG